MPLYIHRHAMHARRNYVQKCCVVVLFKISISAEISFALEISVSVHIYGTSNIFFIFSYFKSKFALKLKKSSYWKFMFYLELLANAKDSSFEFWCYLNMDFNVTSWIYSRVLFYLLFNLFNFILSDIFNSVSDFGLMWRRFSIEILILTFWNHGRLSIFDCTWNLDLIWNMDVIWNFNFIYKL